MKTKILLFCMAGFSSAQAGTPGNSDVSIIYLAAMALLAGMFGIDSLIKYIRRRKTAAILENEANNLTDE